MELILNPEFILSELKKFIVDKFNLDPMFLEDDPTFEDMNADSMTKLEILLYADDTFGSHVLDYIEDGLLKGEPPTRLSELAALVPKCMVSAKDLKAPSRGLTEPRPNA
jgi:hypothetical protein